MKNTKKAEKPNTSKDQKELQTKIKQEAAKNKENLQNKNSKNNLAAATTTSKNNQNQNLKKEKETMAPKNQNLNNQEQQQEQNSSISLNNQIHVEAKNIPDVKLHKVILENFKSFEGKHEIGYFQNFSVVMGPNGSGKSNIIDAICFALGMKTVSLRTKNLKELISKKQQLNDISVDCSSNNNQLNNEAEPLSSNSNVGGNVNINKKAKNALGKQSALNNDSEGNSNSNNNKGAFVELHFRSATQINLNTNLASQLNNNINKFNSSNNLNNKNNNNNNNKKNTNKNKKDNVMDISEEDCESSSSGYIIKFKRTIGSKGASEYFIEDRKTSYEEYLDKLEKLNIPSKARYFILVQGAIDTLLSKKNDLSETIEFLSGSFAYKEKYEELKSQIDAINSEITKHSGEINSIKIDKNKIKMQIQNEEKFNELITDLNRLLEKAFLFRVVKEDMSINFNLDLISQNDFAMKNIQDEKKTNLDLIKKKDLQMKEIEKSFKADDEQGEALKRLQDESNANLINCNEKAKLYEAQIFGKTSMINQKKIEILKNKEKKSALKKSEEAFDKEINLLQQKLQFEDPSAKLPKALIEEYRKTANTFDSEAFMLKKQIAEIKSEIGEAKSKLNQLEKTQQNCEAEKLLCDKELKSAKEREVAEITKRAALEEQLRSFRNQLNEKTKQNAENENSLKQLKSKQDFLQKKLNEFENFSSENSKRKKINELVIKNVKVYGFLFELIAPIKKQLELPVKVALIKYLSYLVVEDNETAKECAEFLKAKEISADVIVLENIPEKSFDENLRNKIGSLGNLVVDLIDCKRKGIKDAVRYLIKDIVLLHDPTPQNLHAAKQRGFTSLITMDGTLFKKGTITTGNYKNLDQYSFNYLANNLEEYAKLGKELEETANAIKALEDAGAKGAFDELSKLQLKICESESLSEASNSNIKSITEAIAKLKSEIKEKDAFIKLQAQKQIYESKENLLAKKMKLTGLENSEEALRKQHFENFMLTHNLSSLKEFESFSIEEIKRLAEEAKLLEEKRAKARLQLRALQAQDEVLEKLEKSLQDDKEKKRVLESEKEILEKIHKENALNYERYKESKSEDYLKLKSFKDEVAKAQTELDRIDRRIRALLKNKVEFEHKVSASIENKKNILQESKLNLENFLSEIGVNLSSIFISFNANLENHFLKHNEILEKQNCVFDYTLIEQKVKYSAEDNIEFELVNQKIANTKNKFCEKIKDLDKYVKVISLIDNEFDKLKDKEDELADKKKEINLLIQSLIAECDAKKKEFEEAKAKRKSLFDEFFEKLSQKLSEVYKELTKPLDSSAPGGSVYIYKTNNEEPYLGHVCYLPTPPGKRCIHDIDLLSGGEKTMAILCLLISLQSICATPLLILDEIDAYLDPHHELILERLFKRKSQEFQVIIVTHKANIFRSAHSLLGTYFNKKKNSSVPISFDLKKLQLDSN